MFSSPPTPLVCVLTLPLYIEARGPSPRPARVEKLGGDDVAAAAKGAIGPPVNCCTMARKLVVSVFSKVVGVRLEARDLLLMGFDTLPSGPKLVAEVGEVGFIVSGGIVEEGVVLVVMEV
ncbi:hypothetical protein L195_g034908 [Trifolium pratense]|uniref:Uncharacterized protein n=1 Tax=Trifolium pratense TaxID=57577 RepID=A0A2K3LK68_TRIPR|nr:hypothetical protein L195_g034908 [Trifolium pratense]